jgi:hypothetical protein
MCTTLNRHAAQLLKEEGLTDASVSKYIVDKVPSFIAWVDEKVFTKLSQLRVSSNESGTLAASNYLLQGRRLLRHDPLPSRVPLVTNP